MSLDFSEIYISLVSNIIGIDLKQIKRVLDKEKLRKSGQVEISDSIDVVSKKLEESKDIIDNALLEMEKQKKLFVQMKKDAEISQQVSEMNKQQVEALNVLLENTLNKQEKKSFPKTFLWNLFFCILSAILGFVLGKYL
ncbi:MAG: hypothetical protein ACLTJL_09930 [Clostridia bacterium]|jgi:hypothetical protein